MFFLRNIPFVPTCRFSLMFAKPYYKNVRSDRGIILGVWQQCGNHNKTQVGSWFGGFLFFSFPRHFDNLSWVKFDPFLGPCCWSLLSVVCDGFARFARSLAEDGNIHPMGSSSSAAASLMMSHTKQGWIARALEGGSTEWARKGSITRATYST